MKILLISTLCLFLTGCASNVLKNSYLPLLEGESLNKVTLLEQGKDPVLRVVDDIEKQLVKYEGKGYLELGNSSYVGGPVPKKHALSHAREIGATLVLFKSEHIKTKTAVDSVLVPNYRGRYVNHSNNVRYYNYVGAGYYPSANAVYVDAKGNKRCCATSYAPAFRLEPVVYQWRQYKQDVVYLAKKS